MARLRWSRVRAGFPSKLQGKAELRALQPPRIRFPWWILHGRNTKLPQRTQIPSAVQPPRAVCDIQISGEISEQGGISPCFDAPVSLLPGECPFPLLPLSSHTPLPQKSLLWEPILLPPGAIRPAFLLHQAFVRFVKMGFAQFGKMKVL